MLFNLDMLTFMNEESVDGQNQLMYVCVCVCVCVPIDYNQISKKTIDK